MKKILAITIILIIVLTISSVKNFMAIDRLTLDNALLNRELINTEAALKESGAQIRERLEALGNDMQNKAEKKDFEATYSLTHNLKTGLETLETELGTLERSVTTNKQDLARLENEIFNPVKVYEKTRKAIVMVAGRGGIGSGFLFGEKNQIITAYHLVNSGPGTEVTIYPNDGYYVWMIGKVKKVKPEWDLAIIELPDSLHTEPLMPADVRNISVGEPIAVMGSPNGFNNSFSAGVISGLRRELNALPQIRFIQFDAAVYFGNSGGAVLNKNGEVIGLVSKAFNDFSFGFAIPISYINEFLEE